MKEEARSKKEEVIEEGRSKKEEVRSKKLINFMELFNQEGRRKKEKSYVVLVLSF
ncbi:hypothetical protein [Okeania sp. KiyG1]|uniref:hypothetical protein n=1 Tax=Okeania sp. KiyG1 TaxID=2720165 RepID=UPI001922384E|nr:hypothetical protein [Okeania sp. KiyG1]GGA18080.1 hypothetical protein CYANOKiyG1_32390 [Okeania sp. KiyG1]